MIFCYRNGTKIEARHESKQDPSTNTSKYFELVLASNERELSLLDLKLMSSNNLRVRKITDDDRFAPVET